MLALSRITASLSACLLAGAVAGCSSSDTGAPAQASSAAGASGASGAANAGFAGVAASGAAGVSGMTAIGGAAGQSGAAPTAGAGGVAGKGGASGTVGAGGDAGVGGAAGGAAGAGTGGDAGSGGDAGAAGNGTGGAPAITIQLLAINDFHGNLEPPTGSNGVIVAANSDPIAKLPGATANPDGITTDVPAGGVTYLATHLASLRAENPNTLIVSAGDLTGASPLLSGLFHDDPSVLVMNAIGLDYNGVGNHEFDYGLAELLRHQNGGCAPGGCAGMTTFPGATFTYLAANVDLTSSMMTIFPPYDVRSIGGVKIAIVGMTLQATPEVTVSTEVAGLTFENATQTVNALVPEMKAKGANAIVMLLHQGGEQGPEGTYDSCDAQAKGSLAPILGGLDPAVDVVVSAHTHAAYNCAIGGRLVTSAESYGRLVTKIDLSFDADGTLLDKTATNVPITRDVAEDPSAQSILATYEAAAAPLANKIVGYISTDITSSPMKAMSTSCQTPMGEVIADGMLAATKDASTGGAVAAFMNFGGLRADLIATEMEKPTGAVTYADAFAVQPFSNLLVTMTLTGADILAALNSTDGATLQVSGITYTYNTANVPRVDATTVMVNGALLDPNASYRITMNNFLSGGGDGYTAFTNGTDLLTGAIDIDALVAYLGAASSMASPLAPPALNRVTGNGCL